MLISLLSLTPFPLLVQDPHASTHQGRSLYLSEVRVRRAAVLHQDHRQWQVLGTQENPPSQRLNGKSKADTPIGVCVCHRCLAQAEKERESHLR